MNYIKSILFTVAFTFGVTNSALGDMTAEAKKKIDAAIGGVFTPSLIKGFKQDMITNQLEKVDMDALIEEIPGLTKDELQAYLMKVSGNAFDKQAGDFFIKKHWAYGLMREVCSKIYDFYSPSASGYENLSFDSKAGQFNVFLFIASRLVATSLALKLVEEISNCAWDYFYGSNQRELAKSISGYNAKAKSEKKQAQLKRAAWKVRFFLFRWNPINWIAKSPIESEVASAVSSKRPLSVASTLNNLSIWSSLYGCLSNASARIFG